MIEHFFTCPYCWERISMILDASEEEASYIEDCQVCCRPIELSFVCDDFNVRSFEAQKMDGI